MSKKQIHEFRYQMDPKPAKTVAQEAFVQTTASTVGALGAVVLLGTAWVAAVTLWEKLVSRKTKDSEETTEEE